MLSGDVEKIATSLSTLTINRLRRKVLSFMTAPHSYSYGEALIFWLADWLQKTQLFDAEMLLVLVEEFLHDILRFGDALSTAMNDDKTKERKLPTCKLGIMDRHFACIDGRETFLDLKTGNCCKTVPQLPLETIVYNLTTLFVCYQAAMKKPTTQVEVANDE